MAERKDRPAPLEWIAAAIGLAIFVTLFGTIFVQAGKGDRASISHLIVEHRAIVAMPGGTHVTFDVLNPSDRTVAAVVISGRLLDGAREVASSEVTIDYVPARSRVGAGLMFGESPAGRRVEVRAVGYREP
jgi:uncharacterized protein (TIGR02588 family)